MAPKVRDPIWLMEKGTFVMFMAEVVGTAVLLFLGCMGSVGTMTLEPPPPMQTALTFGMTVNLIIMMLGHISGAHLNPVITIGAVISGIKSIPTGAIYIVGQFIGATIGYGALKAVTPNVLFSDGIESSTAGLCVTVVHSDISILQGVLVETLCTAIIVCTACGTWDSRCAHTTDSTAIRFGFAVAALSFAASPYTGCSMNPARTFAPALWNNEWENQWWINRVLPNQRESFLKIALQAAALTIAGYPMIYWVGPILGSFLGTYTYKVLFSIPNQPEAHSKSPLPTEMKDFGTPPQPEA